ncbi:uncharacterized protein C8Q71DRAFT_898946 [Rhodofomes roseus]|uniref:Uncharacterized protein n=1 Tax=Rhodofomes roseus TaxID=34475 RepID=A0ABQ8KJ32_9APHY|nr:uncharacterized protein C8Q71DRAFT_898946 [Rhodofomes roseus]KAH9837979.1 hypothetical protein C8Q71DRAFT_898946 [Rhodofomes roseus]
MRNTLPLLSRAPAPSSSSSSSAVHSRPSTDTPPHAMPTIRLISATPSATGSAADASGSTSLSSIAPFAASSPLAPRPTSEAPRKRLVPKKSKLGLLAGVASSKLKDKATKDFSDVVRRVGGDPTSTSSGRGGFEIYVDHAEDEELGEILVVKKKKSRMGLDSLRWGGALGEVTNVPPAAQKEGKAGETLLPVKVEENQKWWSISRGRKDSKGKEKEKEKENSGSSVRAKLAPRSKTPEPVKSLDHDPQSLSRARFNSLDSGIMLSKMSSPAPEQPAQTVYVQAPRERTTTSASQASKGSNGLLAPEPNPATGSIAVRAIKSMRSLARMASWAQLTNNGEQENVQPATKAAAPKKTKEKSEAGKKKKEKKKKDEEKKKEPKGTVRRREDKEAKEATVRLSGSSFEAGALSTQASPHPQLREGAKTLGRKKQSTLGLGLPSSMRLGTATATATMRKVSNASSTGSAEVGQPQAPARLSVDSAHLIMNAQGRPTSIMSSGSSLRPPSTASAISERSKGSSSSSVASVRWDEAGMRSSRELQRLERKSKDSTRPHESRRTSDGRRRTALVDIFPETQDQMGRPLSTSSAGSAVSGGKVSIFERPVVNVESATSDGHSDDVESVASETPAKRARPRPVSEQMLGRPRPSPISEDPDVMLSMLDAATNELASLINRLDLEATPASTHGGSPLRLSPGQRIFEDSPVKRRLPSGGSPLKSDLKGKGKTESMQSLRPYAQMLGALSANKEFPSSVQPMAQQYPDVRRFLGQQIAPWSELDWQVSPKKPVGMVVPRPTHKRTNPPTPALDPPFVFQPLKPAKNNKAAPAMSASPAPRVATPPIATADGAPSSSTFGSRPSKVGLRELAQDASPTPVFKRHARHLRKGSSLATMNTKASELSLRQQASKDMVRISPEARKGLGLGGTLGGRASNEPQVDPRDPDSDIPNELQVIIAGQSDDDCTRRLDETFSRCSTPASPLSPQAIAFPKALPEYSIPDRPPSLPPVPVFQLFDEDDHQADIESSPTSPAEDDTKKSFDFTGELRKLNESGGSDRRSFVEQLENAFRTPAKIGLDYGLDEQLGFKNDFLDVPPVPPLPANLRSTPSEDIAPRSVSNPEDYSAMYGPSGDDLYRDSYASDDIQFDMVTGVDDECRVYPVTKRSGSMRTMASDGQLNVDFKFGGKPTVPSTVEEKSERPLTLSDIIPPLTHSASRSSLVEEDSSVLKSIMAQAAEPTVEEDSVLKSILAQAENIVEVPRRRALSESSSNRVIYDPQSYAAHASNSDHSRRESEASFAGFESFDEVRRGFEFANRPALYPPPGATARRSHLRDESLFSIASISSYGDVLNAGVPDPFGYSRGLSRPASGDVSMSMSVDDTFSFMHRGRRQRIDSDASSFYFRAPGTTFSHGSRRAGHRRDDSRMSVASNAPPVSMYNRSFGGHRRNDSNMSSSSVAQSYAMHGASGGRAAWARHRHDQSVDSVWSDYSAGRLGRPGLGDKMFDNDHGMPLTAISASPPESVAGDLRSNASWESFVPADRRASADESIYEDSEDYHTTMSRDSVFGCTGSNSQYYDQMQRRPFRPVSVISDMSVHHPGKEDDTMITMFDGARVRRLSTDSRIGGSPCVRIEKAKQSTGPLPQRVLQFQPPDAENKDSPGSLNKSKLVEKPSIASTSSQQFGGERMIQARKGLLERQSLEDSALIAHGEDILASLRSQSVFSRPDIASRSRSSTVSASSGGETPPLSLSDGSSQSGGSQSSIDVGQLNALLLNVANPSSGIARNRVRTRARGTGHRRRISQARASRSSVYETIEEESSVTLSPSPAKALSPISSHMATPGDSVFIVDEDSQSMYNDWNDERGITTLRRYYALKDEAHETVIESKQMWMDTPFSIFAVQSFYPPHNRGGMCAMLEHSQKNYGPLPSDLHPRRIRSRTSSRASPYPLPNHRSSFSPDKPMQVHVDSSPELHISPQHPPSFSVLREVPTNVKNQSPVPALEVIKPFTPFSVEFDKSRPDISKDSFVPPVPVRPRVTSSVRRNALGWKRQTGKSSSSSQKENAGQGMLITPSETLRINRPRPQRGRPTPARAFAQIA